VSCVGDQSDPLQDVFGAELYFSVAHFEKIGGSTQYPPLFIVLTFAAHVLSETWIGHVIHPRQYALIGSIGLVVTLAMIMYITRKVDRYFLDRPAG